MPVAKVAKITTSGMTGGKSTSGSPCAAAAAEAADELVVMALSVSHGFDGTAATRVAFAGTGAAGPAAIATVETEQSETATAAAVKLRKKADIKSLLRMVTMTRPFWLQFPPSNANAVGGLLQSIEF